MVEDNVDVQALLGKSTDADFLGEMSLSAAILKTWPTLCRVVVPFSDTDGIMTVQINITPNGRMSLPIDIRKRIGLENGGAVVAEETDNGVVMRTGSQAVVRAQAIAKRYSDGNLDGSVDAFFTQRKAESGE